MTDDAKPDKTPYVNILDEGMGNADGCYVDKGYKCVAALWTLLLGVDIKPRHVPLCMIAVKLAREVYKHHRSNLVDIVTYVKMAEDLMDEEQRNKKPLIRVDAGNGRQIDEDDD